MPSSDTQWYNVLQYVACFVIPTFRPSVGGSIWPFTRLWTVYFIVIYFWCRSILYICSEPHWFKDSLFAVDRLHWDNHTAYVSFVFVCISCDYSTAYCHLMMKGQILLRKCTTCSLGLQMRDWPVLFYKVREGNVAWHCAIIQLWLRESASSWQ